MDDLMLSFDVYENLDNGKFFLVNSMMGTIILDDGGEPLYFETQADAGERADNMISRLEELLNIIKGIDVPVD